MGYTTLDFIFDNKSGSAYDLYLMQIGSSDDEVDLGLNYDIISDSTSISGNYLFGMTNNKPLTFPISFMSAKPIDNYTLSAIARWLFSHKKYKKLQILEDGMENMYYLCKLNNPKKIKIGNQTYGYKCDVVCDCQYAHMNPTKIVRTKTTNPMTIMINNTCDSNEIKYPKIKLYPNKANGTISILNQANGIESKITNLIQGEVITLDSKYKIIESDRLNNNFDRFNGLFTELNPSVNNLTITGDISKIEIEYELLRSIGG